MLPAQLLEDDEDMGPTLIRLAWHGAPPSRRPSRPPAAAAPAAPDPER